MHEVLQTYLSCMYNFTVKDADEIDLNDLLRRKMKEFYIKEAVEKEKTHLIEQEDMVTFFQQGVEILDWFKKKRGNYFSKRSWSLLGIEERLAIPIRGDLHFLGFMDVVMKDEISGKIKIIDIKTSHEPGINIKKPMKLRMTNYYYTRNIILKNTMFLLI